MSNITELHTAYYQATTNWTFLQTMAERGHAEFGGQVLEAARQNYEQAREALDNACIASVLSGANRREE